jgi:hypothetical protein
LLLSAGFFRQGRKGFLCRKPEEIRSSIAGGILDALDSIHGGQMSLLMRPTTLRREDQRKKKKKKLD